MPVFLIGIIIAFAISAPMGAVAIFIIHRIIVKNWESSIWIGVGSILANVIFGLLSSIGVSFLSVFISQEKRSLGILGAIFLFYIGLNVMFSRSNFFILEEKKKEKSLIKPEVKSALKDLSAGFLLTITNPLTFLAILGLMAWLGGGKEVGSVKYVITTIGGLICGLVFWWAGVFGVVSFVKSRIKIPSFKIINKVFGLLLVAASVILLIRLI